MFLMFLLNKNLVLNIFNSKIMFLATVTGQKSVDEILDLLRNILRKKNQLKTPSNRLRWKKS